MPAANVIQLRQLLADKFPGLGTRAEDLSSRPRNFWATGLPQLDEPLRGGLSRGALTEIISPRHSSGSATLMRALLERAARENQFTALVDGTDSFEVMQMSQ